VIPDFLELVDLPENNAVRRYLVQVLNAQIAALAKCQDDSGLWHTLLDDPVLSGGVGDGRVLRYSESGA
jgi:unsaturated rhamnogalacturonyl hydrolase